VSETVLSVIFQRAADLLEQRAHLQRGAMFIPEPDPPPEPFAEVTLHAESPLGTFVELRGRVLQILPGRGMAVAFDDTNVALRALAPLFAEAEHAEDPLAGATWVFWGRPEPTQPATSTDPAPPPDAPEEEEGAAEASKDDEAARLHEQLKTMPTHEKIQLALHGDRTARFLLLKDINKSFQTFVLQNKRITIDEVRYVASFRQAAADVLIAISQNRDWSQNPGIVSALIRNPKTPTPTAVKLLDKLSQSELRRLAKSTDVPRPIQVAARKRVNDA
jgi:hypothetical protein